MLELLVLPQLAVLFSEPELSLSTLLQGYEQAYRRFYSALPRVAPLIDAAAEALRTGHHIYYVGEGAGAVGLIDSSEMVDTYGEDPASVRAFLPGGWARLPTRTPTAELEAASPLFRISTDELLRLPLHPADFVLVVSYEASPALASVTTALRAAGLTVRELQTGAEDLDLPGPLLRFPLFAEFGTKLLFNAITTGACVRKGNVVGNRMVNLGVRNNKLYHRTITNLTLLLGLDSAHCEHSLLQAIWAGEPAPGLSTSAHVIQATEQANIVPLAALIASGLQYSAARDALAQLSASAAVRLAQQRTRS